MGGGNFKKYANFIYEFTKYYFDINLNLIYQNPNKNLNYNNLEKKIK